MQEVGQRVLSLVVAWPVWTGFLLLVSVFAISVRTADLVSMEMYIPFFALACLAIVRLYGGSGFKGDKSTGAKCPSQRLVGMGWRLCNAHLVSFYYVLDGFGRRARSAW